MPDPPCPYVSRGGLKLAAALDAFGVDVNGLACADLGCNAGGFTDCLLQRGAAKVYAVDTGYGALAWKLRNDPRVVTLERTNALHFDPRKLSPGDLKKLKLDAPPRADLVTIDLAWTRQSRAIPAALQWFNQAQAQRLPSLGSPARIITLIKPHYEADRSLLKGGILSRDDANQVLQSVLASLPSLGVRVVGQIESPILGGAGKGKAGNVEFLALLEPGEGRGRSE